VVISPATDLKIDLPNKRQVSALLDRPADARFVYVLAHGAGAGMRHRFLESIARALAVRGVATLRYQFPYMEAGAKRPDSPAVAEETVRAAVATATDLAGDIPVLAGGKSFGGRMTSGAAAKSLPGVRGLVFLGFPLHPPGKPGTSRADHLQSVHLPMLFLQGTRDQFAKMDLVDAVCRGLGPNATLHRIHDGDHSFNVPKRTGRDSSAVIDELAGTIVEWGDRSIGGPPR
jgi:predicted alpha/beta-hydrolase family hydrolase